MSKTLGFLLMGFMLFSCSQRQPTHSKKSGSEANRYEISDSTQAEIEAEFKNPDLREEREDKFNDIKRSEVTGQKRLDALTKAASTYLSIFKFNMWTGSDNKNDRTNREALFTEPGKEFMERMVDLSERFRLSKLSPLFDIRNEKDEFTFYAFAISMKGNLQELLEKTLRDDYMRTPLEPQNEVFVSFENRKVVIALFKARMDILAALALKELSNQAKSNFGQNVEGFFKKASFSHLKFVEIPDVLVKENNQVLSLLKEAANVKTFLLSIGEDAPMEKNLKAAYRHAEVSVGESHEDINVLINKLIL